MTDKEKVQELCNFINLLDDQGVLSLSEQEWYYNVINAEKTAFYISTIHIKNLGTQVREAIIENGAIHVYSHTKYVYDMCQHQIDTSIALNDIVDCAITLRANGNTTLTIDYADDIEDFYFEKQDEGLALYQFIAKYLANRK